MKTLTEQLACARRELAMRKNVYAARVRQSKMKPEEARHEFDCMEAIVQTLERALTLENVSREMAQLPGPAPEPPPSPDPSVQPATAGAPRVFPVSIQADLL